MILEKKIDLEVGSESELFFRMIQPSSISSELKIEYASSIGAASFSCQPDSTRLILSTNDQIFSN